MARDAGGLVGPHDAEFLFQHAQGGNRVGHDRRLGVGGQRQLAFGPVLHHGGKLLVQRVVDFLEHFAGMRAGFGELHAHADLLASLSG